VIAGRGALRAFRASDGSPRWSAALPWTGPTRLAVDDDEGATAAAGSAAIVAVGPGGAATAFDGAGKVLWSAEGEGRGPPPHARLSRGVLLLAGDGLRILDAREGIAVARLPGPADAARWTAAPDLTIALAEGSELLALRLATHLSVV
jgi:outer membrane protein assembly factor BamB